MLVEEEFLGSAVKVLESLEDSDIAVSVERIELRLSVLETDGSVVEVASALIA